LDVCLPDGSGFDLCRRLCSEGISPAIPILFISASEDIVRKVDGFDAGGVDYITKPIVGAEVIARVRTHLRLREAYLRLAEFQADRMSRLAAAQQDLMPWPDSIPHSHFYAHVQQVLPAGGDFYDVIPTGSQVVDYLVADASGHDLAASLWTASLKALAVEYAASSRLPDEIMHAMNSSLCRILPREAFFTMIYARLDHETRRLNLVSAGHTPAIIVHTDQNEATVIRLDGDVLGAFGDANFGQTEMKLNTGDRLVLYTDGLIDCRLSYEQSLQQLSVACLHRRNLPLSDSVRKIMEDLKSDGNYLDDRLMMGIEL